MRRRMSFWRSVGVLATVVMLAGALHMMQTGLSNLVLARAAKAKKRAQRLRLERIRAAKRFSAPSR